MAKDSKAKAKSAKGAKGGTKKKTKDPNAPKRPLSAYFFYQTEIREQVKKDNPDATFGDLGKIIGAKWKELSESEKAVYNKKAEGDKVRYKKAMEKYTPPQEEASDEDDE